jgi:hypothetical protein
MTYMVMVAPGAAPIITSAWRCTFVLRVDSARNVKGFT